MNKNKGERASEGRSRGSSLPCSSDLWKKEEKVQNSASTAAGRATAEDVAAAVFAAALADDVAQAKSAPPLIGPASSSPSLSFFFGWHHERASERSRG